MAKHTVFIDGDWLTAVAAGFESRRWNGFVCPLFDKEGADALVLAWREATGLDAHYDAATDSYVFENEDDHEPDAYPSRMWNGLKVWPIGAGCWTWNQEEE